MAQWVECLLCKSNGLMFDPATPHRDGRRQQTPRSSPLTFTRASWHVCPHKMIFLFLKEEAKFCCKASSPEEAVSAWFHRFESMLGEFGWYCACHTCVRTKVWPPRTHKKPRVVRTDGSVGRALTMQV